MIILTFIFKFLFTFLDFKFILLSNVD